MSLAYKGCLECDDDFCSGHKRAKHDDAQNMTGDHHCAYASETISALTDDALYHLFNGADVDGAPIFPPQCRWAPALVYHRWRAIIESITYADIQHAHARLDNYVRDGISSKGLHRVVSASGLALMARHGLASFGVWTAVGPSLAEVAALLIALDHPVRVGEALAIAAHASKGDSWKELGDALNATLDVADGRSALPHTVASPKQARRTLLWVAARHCTTAILYTVSNDCNGGCVFSAIEHAIRFDRPAAVATLLHVYDAELPESRESWYDWSQEGRRYDTNADNVWFAVSRWGALSVARMLLDIETCGLRPVGDDLKYALSRMGQYDRDWSGNWIDTGAARNDRPECLDFCHQHGLGYYPYMALGHSVHCGSVAFCRRLVDLNPPSVNPGLLIRAIDVAHYLGRGQYFHPHSAMWLMCLPELERPDDQLVFHQLLESALHSDDNGTDLCALLQRATAIVRRWPDAATDMVRCLPSHMVPHITAAYSSNHPDVVAFLGVLPPTLATDPNLLRETHVGT